MSQFTENRDRRCREIVAEIPRSELFPAYKKKGMRDCVADWYGYYNIDWDFYLEAIIAFTKPIGGGEREFDQEAFSNRYMDYLQGDSNFGYSLVGPSATRLRNYHVYLCTDGKARYYYNEEAERNIRLEARKSSDKEYAAYVQFMHDIGYHEVGDGWVNDETGEETGWAP